MARGRQAAEGQGTPARPDAWPRLWRRQRVLVPVSVVVGRQGSRGRRQADEGRYLPCAAAKGSGRPVQLARAAGRHGDGLWQEPETRERLPPLVPWREDL